ncbi:MAG: cryptochrome/photolyase family protein [Candidatus Dormibacter sp.]|uniref:cryptochrome/photolyase family protein n=1 Tax=Candidatus Dormibacter sp. TaxID=2973982 RepID=UPI000DB0DC09|nr:MAG: deoxyribodipyrimidine photolyase [Candidatus Dormibacteraeota bacterium]
MSTGCVLFTADLRRHDNPALSAACRCFDAVLPLFVHDRGLARFASPNRSQLLRESLRDLDSALGGALLLRRGDIVDETLRAAREADAKTVWLSAGVTAYARRREGALATACRDAGIEFRLFPGVTVVPPGELTTGEGGPFTVFTPYYRRWRAQRWREVGSAPRPHTFVSGLASSEPEATADSSPDLLRGGESAARERLERWLAGPIDSYGELHDQLGAQTSRLSADLHFGCLSPLEVAVRALERGAETYARQLCWRDFAYQLTAAFPNLGREDFRPRGGWRHDDLLLSAWQQGRTGYPVIDAAMRQLREEGWLNNRARLLVASFLTKDLGIDWRDGAAHFMDLLVDADVANNSLNWQWVAGTGTDSRPYRIFNPTLQARRFDPRGVYVRRYVPELAALDDRDIHEPWLRNPLINPPLDYPPRIVDHAEAARDFRHRIR